MKVKNYNGEWKPVKMELNFSVSGESSKDVQEIIKMFEDFMSTTLVTPYSLTLTQTESKATALPYPQTRKS